MDSDRKSLDLLGLKGLSDSIKIATAGSLAGAAAFLSRVCLPAAEEFGLALRDKVGAWRARNAAQMLSKANDILDDQEQGAEGKAHPRLVMTAIEEASWTDDEVVQRMWAGLLASATSPDASDENMIFLNILRQLSSLQVRILRFAVESAKKFDAGLSLPFAEDFSIKADKLSVGVGCTDFQRLDRELDHLVHLGLIGGGMGGGLHTGTDDVDLTPAALALHLFVRAQGSKASPVQFWQLLPKG